MRQIRSTRTLADAYMLRDVLQREGIPATIRNEHLPGSGGEVPVMEEMPVVCVADGDVARALFILGEYIRDDDAALALEDMVAETGTGVQGRETHDAMVALLLAATRLARQPHHGDSIEELIRHGALVDSTDVPFGIPPKVWSAIGRLAAAAVDGAVASDEAEVRARALELREVLQGFLS